MFYARDSENCICIILIVDFLWLSPWFFTLYVGAIFHINLSTLFDCDFYLIMLYVMTYLYLFVYKVLFLSYQLVLEQDFSDLIFVFEHEDRWYFSHDLLE